MKVLVIGKGGREHALVKALSQSSSINAIYCIPGSKGIEKLATCVSMDLNNINLLTDFIRDVAIQLVVIGPELYLAKGLSDQLRSANIAVVGPSQMAAQLESSKLFAKRFMVEAGVPTARYEEVTTVGDTLKKAEHFQGPWVLKADGLAAGKGVFICKTLDELKQSAEFIFEEKGLGEAGSKAFLEEFEPGWELSYLILTNGADFKPLVLAQDHKRLLDGDHGPNTGGMGTVAPLKISASLNDTIVREILEPTVRQLSHSQLLFRGILFVGIMVTPNGPRVLEYNVRFGDPEAQVILPLLDGDWGKVFYDLSQGRLTPLKWKALSCACVVLSSAGYPGDVKTGPIVGDLFSDSPDQYFLHAGVGFNNQTNSYFTEGGRVLNAIGIGRDISQALIKAYEQVEKVRWAGMQYRKDIGEKKQWLT